MNLHDPPTSSRGDLVADWLEFAAASDINGQVVGDSLVDRREEVNEREGGQQSPTKADHWRREAEEIWVILRARAAFYGAAYPFTVEEDALELTTAPLDDHRLAYAFLLAAANLAAFGNADRHYLTDGFERASRYAMAALLPSGSTVSIFGTSSQDGERYSHGSLIHRLEKLAEDLATELTNEGREEAANAKPRTSGDGGLDLVGWPDVIGPRKRLPVYFGQCACGDEWKSKPYEVIPLTWDHRLSSVSWIVPVTLIPYAHRKDDNDWLDLFSVPPTVLIDRPRWLGLIQDTDQLDDVVAEVPSTWMLAELPGLSAA